MDDLRGADEGTTLFEKLILAPFPVLDRLHKRFGHHEFQKEIVQKGRTIWKVKDEWQIFLDKYEKLVRNRINTGLVDRYKIRCCPYCNENYVFNRADKAGAQLDHFFPKDRYPLFALSLHNLVPACPACNHIKQDQTLGVSPQDGRRDFESMRMTYLPGGGNWIMDEQELDIIFQYLPSDTDPAFAQDIQINVDRLKLTDAYQNHRDHVQELVNRAFWYNEAAFAALQNSLGELCLSEAEMLRMVFGTYVEPERFLKRPLSRLSRDILTELGVLRRSKKE